MHTQLKRRSPTSFHFPEPLLEWLDEESEKFGMSRNAYVTMRFQQMKEFDVMRQIQNLGVRVTQLEHKMR